MQADRARAQQVLDELAAAYDDVPDVDRAPMFGSEALRVLGKVFAFVGREGQLIVKLPAPRVAELLAAAAAKPVHVGRNATREWAGIPPTTDPTQWRALLAEAHAFVSAAARSSDRPR
ncbi:hypothetical protein [Kribbella lupini]|uniref:DNA-binding protein (MmcQ/YjbR family) n=1 Tax=Kribbella lupini TaxID=291602 RepID=A0ABN2A6C4_9ACTN